MPNDLDVPPELRFDPMLATAGVHLVDPEMLCAGKLLVSAVEQQGNASAILDVCCVHFGTKDEATSIDENVAFAAVDAFGTIVAPNTADASGSNRLAIDDRSTRLRVAANPYTELLTQDGVEMLPRAVHAPQTEIVIRGLPGWELVRQQPPRATTSNDVEDCVQDLANRMQPRSADGLGRREQRVQASEFRRPSGRSGRVAGQREKDHDAANAVQHVVPRPTPER